VVTGFTLVGAPPPEHAVSTATSASAEPAFSVRASARREFPANEYTSFSLFMSYSPQLPMQ
jgi:hypothetical protein